MSEVGLHGIAEPEAAGPHTCTTDPYKPCEACGDPEWIGGPFLPLLRELRDAD